MEPEGESTEVVQEVEETPSLSFDDFMRMREEARMNSTVLSASRAPRQVNLESQFSGLTTKEDELEGADSKMSKSTGQKKDQRSTNKTQLLDVQFKFEAANNFQRQGGRRERDNTAGRGGRFGGRAESGRFGGRTRKPRDTPAPLNSGDFPSL